MPRATDGILAHQHHSLLCSVLLLDAEGLRVRHVATWAAMTLMRAIDTQNLRVCSRNSLRNRFSGLRSLYRRSDSKDSHLCAPYMRERYSYREWSWYEGHMGDSRRGRVSSKAILRPTKAAAAKWRSEKSVRVDTGIATILSKSESNLTETP